MREKVKTRQKEEQGGGLEYTKTEHNYQTSAAPNMTAKF